MFLTGTKIGDLEIGAYLEWHNGRNFGNSTEFGSFGGQFGSKCLKIDLYSATKM